ncbi:MAG: AAA family ATPase, partial [Pyrinomonadaceae bacterium]
MDNLEVPSGAVIQLKLSAYDLDALKRCKLEIGGHPATFTVLEGSKADEPRVAAVVPDMQRARQGGGPALIVFFTEQGHGGDMIENFRVIPSASDGYKATVASVTRQPNERYFDLRLREDIPTAQWGRVKISIDDRPVERIVRMLPRVFSFEVPANLPYLYRHELIVEVGGVRSNVHTLNSSFTSEPDPTPSAAATPVAEANTALDRTFLGFPVAWTLTFFGIALGVVGGFLSFYFYRQAKLNAAKVWLGTEPASPDQAEKLSLPEDLPPPLVTACAAGECVLYAGAGLSAASGLPTWKEFVLGLIDWALIHGIINESEADDCRADLRRGQADPVADNIVGRIKTRADQERLYDYLREVFLRKTSPSQLHSHLKRIKFSAVLTTNFDNILEGIYATSHEQVYTPKDTEPLLAALTRRDFFILKLYGKLDGGGAVMVAPAQYEEEIASNGLFSRFMQTLFYSRTILFVGASLEGIEAYLRGINFQMDNARRHYALVGVTEIGWRSKASFLKRRYGIEVLPYTPEEGYPGLDRFLRQLAKTVNERAPATSEGKQQRAGLEQVTLENIGPFDRLELKFDLSPEMEAEGKWQIFLGDNGVGKSTVLRAIAFALCGSRAQAYASRLLKVGARRGSITLTTGSGTNYVTNIERKQSGEVVIVGAGGDNEVLPLGAEGWLAIGFPPLRTTSWTPVMGADPDFKIKSAPVVDDLLPLVTGDVDPRLDKLKKWIINLDYEDVKSGGKEWRYQGLIQKVFDIIGSMTEGMKLNYVGVIGGRGEEKRILIETDNGTEIRLESLSQGTLSLLGWVGILMQRLYEVFDQDEDPTTRYALILMDEIDAHMHPLWQRKLFTHLKGSFPRAQFIATTHSPLVVSGMSTKQVVRFARNDEGKAVVLTLAPDVTFGYTDQVLTSLLFGLPTTLDLVTEEKKTKYNKLKMKEGGERQPEYEVLKQQLMARIPPRTPSYDEKHKKQW